jgi:tripartite-type tricarboxylate transporter receptor subunit TctC
MKIKPNAIAGLLIAACGAIGVTQAQTSSNAPIRVTSAFPPGSGPDVVVRLIAQKVGSSTGAPMVVEAKPGGGGMVAANSMSTVKANDRELLFTEIGQLVINKLTRKDSNFDPDKDLIPVATLVRTPFFIVVGNAGRYKTYGDLVSHASQNPGKVTYGSSGVGTPLHLGGAQLELALNTKMVHAPYRDFSQLNQDITTGVVDWSFGTFGSSGALVKSGHMRFLGVAAPTRAKIMPDVPTIAELGGPAGVEVSTVLALFAPRGSSAEAAQQLNAQVSAALKSPEVAERLSQMGYEPIPESPKYLGEFMRKEQVRYADLIRKANLKLE